MRGGKRAGVADDLLRQYLREIGAYPLLTAADEVALATAMEAGSQAEAALASANEVPIGAGERRRLREAVETGRQARQRFIQSNLRFVVAIAKRYQLCGLPLIDLIQEGNLGLMRAVEKFDHRKGFKFSTYASWWIRQALGRAIADKSRTIRVPVHMVETVSQVSQASARLARSLGRDPTADEIAEATGLRRDKVEEARRVGRDPVSLFAEVGDDDAELIDFLEDPSAQLPFDAAVTATMLNELRSVLGALSPREQQVLEMRFGLRGERPLTLEEVGQVFNLTRERIRQIEAKAMCKLRHPSTPALSLDPVLV